MTDYRFEWSADNPRWTYLKVTDADDPDWDGWSFDPSDGDTPEYLEKSAEAFQATAAWLRAEHIKASDNSVGRLKRILDADAGYFYATGRQRLITDQTPA